MLRGPGLTPHKIRAERSSNLSFQKLRGAGPTPHFHDERSSNVALRALLSLFCSLFLVPGVFTDEGEAVDSVTPAGLPQEPSPSEEDKFVHATSTTSSRWIPLGAVGHFAFFFVVHFLLLFLFVLCSVYDGYASS